MKTSDQVCADIARRLARTWAADVAAGAGDATGTKAWPHAFPLGRDSSARLVSQFADVTREVLAWQQWSRAHPEVEVTFEQRRVGGTPQRIPTHVAVASIDVAAAMTGDPWPARLARARSRAAVLARRFPGFPPPADGAAGPTGSPGMASLARLLSETDDYPDVDFDVLLDAADWCARTPAHVRAQMTPRQVPVAGMHAKWLNSRRHLVAALADLPDLGLAAPHPARIHFTYLDPDHLAGGGRRHDVGTVGDPAALPYHPEVVLISENKDTAVGFPAVRGGVAVEGAGRGGSPHAQFAWIRDAPVLAYWGDMDAAGLEILDEFRRCGLPVSSLLMDVDAFERWERFAVTTDAAGRELGPRTPAELAHLTVAEAALYERLTSPDYQGPRRLEQERIPLSVATDALASLRHAAAFNERPSPPRSRDSH